MLQMKNEKEMFFLKSIYTKDHCLKLSQPFKEVLTLCPLNFLIY